MKDLSRKEFLKLAAGVGAGAALAAAGCGGGKPPSAGEAEPHCGAASGFAQAHALDVALVQGARHDRGQGSRPRGHHPRRRGGPGRHEPLRRQGRRRGGQAQHLHRLPWPGIRGDDQSRRRRHPGEDGPRGRSQARARHGPALWRHGRQRLPGQRHRARRRAGRRHHGHHEPGRLQRRQHPQGTRHHVVALLLRDPRRRRGDQRAHRQEPRRRRPHPRLQELHGRRCRTPISSTRT